MNILQMKRNECKRLVRPGNRVINTVRFSDTESRFHLAKKEEVCFGLKQSGKQFITEAIIDKLNTRADILVLDDFLVIEIVVSESVESLELKRFKYSSIGLQMQVIRVGD